MMMMMMISNNLKIRERKLHNMHAYLCWRFCYKNVGLKYLVIMEIIKKYYRGQLLELPVHCILIAVPHYIVGSGGRGKQSGE